MKKRQIANIVNFVRACEPRAPLDLAEPVICQLELMKKHSLPGTFLLQYDALIDPKFSGLFADTGVSLPQMHIQRNRIDLIWEGFPYRAAVSRGHAHQTGLHISSQNGNIELAFA